jgi:hypothetical protein
MKSKQNMLAGIVALSLALCGTATASPMAGPTPAAAPGGPVMRLDQVNAARWDKAWTNLVNDAQQTFTPSMPRLLAIDVGLVVANDGPLDDELTLTVMDTTGEVVAVVTEVVQASDCDRVMFTIPKDGIDVTPGQTYRIRLTGGTRLGWKYVVGGYEKGAATFNGKPLLPKARSTFLFRTFGTD